MSPLASPILRLSDAATATGLTKKDIRNWIDRGTLTLFSQRNEGWLEFSYADIAQLSLIAEMTRLGLAPAQASRIAHRVIEETGLVEGIFIPPLALPGVFTLKALLIWQQDGELVHQVIREAELSQKPHSTRRALILMRPAFIIQSAILSIEEPDDDADSEE